MAFGCLFHERTRAFGMSAVLQTVARAKPHRIANMCSQNSERKPLFRIFTWTHSNKQPHICVCEFAQRAHNITRYVHRANESQPARRQRNRRRAAHKQPHPPQQARASTANQQLGSQCKERFKYLENQVLSQSLERCKRCGAHHRIGCGRLRCGLRSVRVCVR